VSLSLLTSRIAYENCVGEGTFLTRLPDVFSVVRIILLSMPVFLSNAYRKYVLSRLFAYLSLYIVLMLLATGMVAFIGTAAYLISLHVSS